jgi:hypothetical protein
VIEEELLAVERPLLKREDRECEIQVARLEPAEELEVGDPKSATASCTWSSTPTEVSANRRTRVGRIEAPTLW